MEIKRSLKAIMLFGVSVLVLTGCSQTKSNGSDSSISSHKVSQKADSSKKAEKKESDSSNQESSNQDSQTALWNDHQDDLLTQFINQWAPKMNQEYTKYDGEASLKVSTGTVYPDDLAKVMVNGNKTTIGMSKDGNGENEYNVVAIYNYDGTKPPLPNHITYIFAFRGDQPVALVDQSRDGVPDLRPTQNTEVQKSFAQIANQSDFAKSEDEEQTNNKQAKDGSDNIKPITDRSEAIAIASKAFSSVEGHTAENNIEPSTGPEPDGSYILKTYSGAKGLDIYTIKPLADNKAAVNARYGSVQGGEFNDAGTKIVERP
ncbi:MAG TPA: DUF4767 domain-containing protein [Candidatus Ligilactobacillus excrementipullorum]|nr:DUF4767 domain-containing protein [Candidatus Ligilactobacillus excrementipullorum]